MNTQFQGGASRLLRSVRINRLRYNTEKDKYSYSLHQRTRLEKGKCGRCLRMVSAELAISESVKRSPQDFPQLKPLTYHLRVISFHKYYLKHTFLTFRNITRYIYCNANNDNFLAGYQTKLCLH